MVVGFVAIHQFSLDFVTSVHVCPKSYATHVTFVSRSSGYARGGVQRENLHGEVFTVKVFAVVCEGRRRQLLSMIQWEIEGFLMTVGDGYRKLGGHGREMILRRNGDSHLVNVEFKDGLLGCKKSMMRDLTGLVTHENSDVAGHSAAAVVDERRATSSTIELSRCETVESHTSTQVPFASLCRACIVGRGREAPQPFHLGGEEAVIVAMLVVLLDVFFFLDFDRQHHWRGQHAHNCSHHARSWFYGSNSRGMCESTQRPGRIP